MSDEELREKEVYDAATHAQDTPQAGVIGWVERNPRRVVWILVLALIPYILLCWGVAMTVFGALLVGGCG